LGFIKRDIRNGRSTYYFIADPRTWFTPAQDSPPNVVHPTPERGSPITIKEPSDEPSVNHQKGAKPTKMVLPDWLPLAAWNGYMEMRKEKRKAPTVRAVELLLAELHKLLMAGQDIAAVLDKSTRNGWTDVYAIKPDPVRGVGKAIADIDAINARNNAEAKRLLGITDNDDLRMING